MKKADPGECTDVAGKQQKQDQAKVLRTKAIESNLQIFQTHYLTAEPFLKQNLS